MSKRLLAWLTDPSMCAWQHLVHLIDQLGPSTSGIAQALAASRAMVSSLRQQRPALRPALQAIIFRLLGIDLQAAEARL